ncbi:MAG: GNAT family N-acetyltransferase [Thermoplasmatota archaeon]
MSVPQTVPHGEGPEVQIRSASVEDIPALLGALEWLFEPPGRRPADWDPAEGAKRLERTLASPRSCILVAMLPAVGERIVGICTCYLDLESVRFGQRAWVEDLAVAPDCRSHGVGRRLLHAAKDWARAAGASHLGLESSEHRKDAHRFYDREAPTSRSRFFTWDVTKSPDPPREAPSMGGPSRGGSSPGTQMP